MLEYKACERRADEQKVRIILNIILGLILVACMIGLIFLAIYCGELNHNMFLKEYNAQMDRFGYYKSDICLFDQHADMVKCIWSMFGVVFGWVFVIICIIWNIVDGLVNGFDTFLY